MTELSIMTPEEADALNKKTRTDLAESVEQYETKKTAQVSSAIQTLINVTESETHDIEFSGPAGSCILKIMASPSQNILKDLFRIGSKNEGDYKVSIEDEDRLCKILEHICIDPKISYDMWKSGQLSDELIATIIFELMKRKVTKHEDMVTEIETFRPDKRRSTNPGSKRATKKAPK